MRRWSVAALVATSLVALPLAATAQVQELTIEFQHASASADPEQARLWTPRSKAVIDGTWRIVVDASSGSPIRNFEVKIHSEDPKISDPGPAGETKHSHDLGANKTSDRLILEWDTSQLTPYNSTYRIVARATDWVDNAEVARVTTISVNNAPSTPARPNVRLADGVPQLTWEANTEPDILDYTIFRSVGALEFKGIDSVGSSKTLWTDDDAPKGVTLRYRLVARRHSPISDDGIVSAPSAHTDPLLRPLPKGEATPDRELTPSDPKELASVAPKTVIRNPSNGGFANLLPYSSDELGLPFAAPNTLDEEIAQQNYILDNQSLSERLTNDVINKPPFIAAGLIALVVALHMARVARKLFKAS